MAVPREVFAAVPERITVYAARTVDAEALWGRERMRCLVLCMPGKALLLAQAGKPRASVGDYLFR